LRGLANLKYFNDPTHTSILGSRVSSPICFGPVANQGIVCKDAELASVRAAGKLQQLYCLSTFSSCSLEEVAA